MSVLCRESEREIIVCTWQNEMLVKNSDFICYIWIQGRFYLLCLKEKENSVKNLILVLIWFSCLKAGYLHSLLNTFFSAKILYIPQKKPVILALCPIKFLSPSLTWLIFFPKHIDKSFNFTNIIHADNSFFHLYIGFVYSCCQSLLNKEEALIIIAF